jgi:hypothetical protein
LRFKTALQQPHPLPKVKWPMPGIEWYPEGRLVVWMALLAAAGISLFVLLNSSGPGGFQANMNTQLEPLFKALASSQMPRPPNSLHSSSKSSLQPCPAP